MLRNCFKEVIIIPTPATLKCDWCKKTIKQNTLYVKHSATKKFHDSCYVLFKTNNEDRNNLYDYIIKLQGHKVLNPKILYQIKYYQENYDLNYRGIELALRYFHEIQGKPFDIESVGIVPSIYVEAEKYYQMLLNIADFAETHGYNPQEETVYINDNPRKTPKKLVDIEEIT